jgi:hypothetical protein
VSKTVAMKKRLNQPCLCADDKTMLVTLIMIPVLAWLGMVLWYIAHEDEKHNKRDKFIDQLMKNKQSQ